MKLSAIDNAIKSFFFKPQPVHSVAILRILFGILLLFNWAMIWSHLNIFWGPEGLVSLETSIRYGADWRFSFFDFLPDDPKVPVLLAWVNLLASLGVLLGIFSRTSVLIAFLTILSFHNRNVFILNSADLIFRNILFLLTFTPCGDVYSLDRWIKSLRGKAQPLVEEKSPWGLRLIQIQFCFVYIATVMFKMKGSYWADGTAIYIATRLDEFLRVPLPILNNIMMIKILTWGTLLVELALGTFVWIKELRYWILLAGVGLHLGIEVTMNIPMFEWVMIFSMVSMVNSRDLYEIDSWLRSRIQNLFLRNEIRVRN